MHGEIYIQLICLHPASLAPHDISVANSDAGTRSPNQTTGGGWCSCGKCVVDSLGRFRDDLKHLMQHLKEPLSQMSLTRVF